MTLTLRQILAQKNRVLGNYAKKSKFVKLKA
jgi:hypothetical protein